MPTQQDEFPEVLSPDGFAMLQWEYVNEGYSGFYNPDDPDDAPLLRFTIYEWIEGHYSNGHWVYSDWQQKEDASYCTLLPVGTDADLLRRFGERLLGATGRRELEFLTWTTPEELERAYSPKGD